MSRGSHTPCTTRWCAKVPLINSTGFGLSLATLITSRSIFYPKRGLGPGCKSPLEFQTMLLNGLKGLNGGCEMLWQLANFDFATWLDGCVSLNFKYYG
eukprot:6211068-Pleurochrysis_carterae.AAC.2